MAFALNRMSSGMRTLRKPPSQWAARSLGSYIDHSADDPFNKSELALSSCMTRQLILRLHGEIEGVSTGRLFISSCNPRRHNVHHDLRHSKGSRGSQYLFSSSRAIITDDVASVRGPLYLPESIWPVSRPRTRCSFEPRRYCTTRLSTRCSKYIGAEAM